MPPSPTEPVFDPTFLNARREAGLILCAWAACLLWTVGYSALAGYRTPSDPIPLVLGMPGWVFWGVLVPWLAATLFSIWFGLSFIADDALDAPADETASHA